MKNVHKPSTSIKTWNPDDRPREKLLRHGPQILSDTELLAILIGTGGRQGSALQLSAQMLKENENSLSELARREAKELSRIKGIGEAKSVVIMAAMELGRRRSQLKLEEKPVVRSSQDAARFLTPHLRDLNHEEFAVLFLNRANRIIGYEVISRGGITGTVADPRIILKKAIQYAATGIILSHNHPSGNLSPSRADEELTRKIRSGAEWVDIKVLDHLIICDSGYLSFADEGLL